MDDRRDWRCLIAALLGVDVVCLLAAGLAAAWLHGSLSWSAHDSPATLAAVMLVTAACVFPFQGLYDPHRLLAGTSEYAAVVRCCVFGLAAVSLFSFSARQSLSREWIGLSWTLAAGLLLVGRFLARRVGRRLRRRGLFMRRALVIGADANAVALASQLEKGDTGLRVVGFLDDYHAVGSVLLRDAGVVGRPDSLPQVAARTGARDAIIMPQALAWETLQQLIAGATLAPDRLRIHLSAGFHDLLTTGVRLSECNHVPLLTVNKARLSRKESLIKMSLDYVTAVLLLATFAPAMGLMAGWQRLRGERQLLSRRRVAGRYGASFDLLELRSSAPFDSSMLRKLPGLLNVIHGQLSIVGPRPIGAANPASRPLGATTLRPGLTGPWREADDPAEQALLDLYYLRTYSVWLDLQVLFWRVLYHLRVRRVRAGGVAWAAARWQ